MKTVERLFVGGSYNGQIKVVMDREVVSLRKPSSVKASKCMPNKMTCVEEHYQKHIISYINSDISNRTAYIDVYVKKGLTEIFLLFLLKKIIKNGVDDNVLNKRYSEKTEDQQCREYDVYNNLKQGTTKNILLSNKEMKNIILMDMFFMKLRKDNER